MKSLERRYDNVLSKNSNLGSIVCFYHAVAEQNFSKKVIRHWFHKLVDKGDYDRADLKTILNELGHVSQSAEEGKKQGIIEPTRVVKYVTRHIAHPAVQKALF